MTDLIIDTAFETCQVALARSNQLIASDRTTSGGQHDRVLANMVDTLFDKENITIQDIQKIIVTTGPGRFTGLRVGIAFARGLVLVHNTPLIGIMTSDAIAHDMAVKYPHEKNKAVLIAVKRGETFVQTYTPTPSDIVSVMDDALVDHLRSFDDVLIGGVLSPIAASMLQAQNMRIAADITEPSLESLAVLGAEKHAENQSLSPVRPYYAA